MVDASGEKLVVSMAVQTVVWSAVSLDGSMVELMDERLVVMMVAGLVAS